MTLDGQIQPEEGLTGPELNSDKNKATANKAAFNPTHYSIVPHIAFAPTIQGNPNSSFWQTTLSIKDLDNNPTNIRLSAYDNGNNLLATNELNLQGHGMVDKGINVLFPGLSNEQYSTLKTVYVEADGDVAVAERFGAQGVEGGMQLKTVRALDLEDAKSQLMSSKAYLAHLANNTSFWNGLVALVDTPGATVNLDLNRTEDGELITQRIIQEFYDGENPIIKMAKVIDDLAGNQLGKWAVIKPLDGAKVLSTELYGIHKGVSGSKGVLTGINAATEKSLTTEQYILFNPRVDWAGIAVCNINSEVANLEITSYIDGSSEFNGENRFVAVQLNPEDKAIGLVGVTNPSYQLPLEDMLLGTTGDKPSLIKLSSDKAFFSEIVQGDDARSHNEGALGFTVDDSAYKLSMNFAYGNTDANHNGSKIIPHDTIMQVANIGDSSVDLVFRHYNKDGSLNISKTIQDVGPNMTFESKVEDLFGFESMQGSIEVEKVGGDSRIIGSYVLHSSDESNGTIEQNNHRQSSMFKMEPVNRNSMALEDFQFYSDADNYVELGIETMFNIGYSLLGHDNASKIKLCWSDGSVDEIEAGGFAGGRQVYKTFTESGDLSVIIEGFATDNEKSKFREERNFLVSDGMRDIEPTTYKLFGEGDPLPIGVSGLEAGLEQNDSVSVYKHAKVDIDCDEINFVLGDKVYNSPVVDGEIFIEGTSKLSGNESYGMMITYKKDGQTVKQTIEILWTNMPNEKDYDIDAIHNDSNAAFNYTKNDLNTLSTILSQEGALYGSRQLTQPEAYDKLDKFTNGVEADGELSNVLINDLTNNQLVLELTRGPPGATWNITGINSEKIISQLKDFYAVKNLESR
jgi:hypothetical protein